MTSIFDAIGYTCVFLSCGIMISIGLSTVAALFVQDFIDRHERQHHRHDKNRTLPPTDDK